MFAIQINAVFSCVIGLVYGHVDSFISSPDVDTQAGFFPDSGFLKTNTHLETYSPGISYHPHYHPNHLNTDFVSNNVNPYFPRNDMDRVVPPAELLTKRLQRLMAAMSHRKLNKVVPVTNQEDAGYLLMFTGVKDNKG